MNVKSNEKSYFYQEPQEVDIKEYIKNVLSKNTKLEMSEIEESCDVFSKGMSSYYYNSYYET